MRDYILLFVNGREHRVTGPDAFLTLSDFLRLRVNLCGTKIVCSEGDCGSCTVLCANMNAVSQEKATDYVIKYFSIDSCIRFVFQLDGCHIVTVEGLAIDGRINGVQKAMIDCHGSQCGFCTPGFVMAMTGILEENDSPTTDQWRHGLTGNLCRCTGYSPIIKAGLESSSTKMNARYPAANLVATVSKSSGDTITISDNTPNERTRTVFCPTTIAQAVEFLDAHPDARIVSGATDVGVQFNKGYCNSQTWLDLNRVEEIAGVSVKDKTIVAGARATWTEIENLTQDLVPQFHNIVSIFGSPQIRNAGTIGGNIINASPIADSLPFLYVNDAELEITGKSGTRSVKINGFYSGYKQFDLRLGELLTGIRIPLPDPTSELRLYKVSRRRDLDISTFTAAISVQLDGDTIEQAAIAYGAVGPVVLRLPKTESFLCGKRFDLETMEKAGDIAVAEITPISDVRGGADFRFQLARNVLLKFFHEVKPAAQHEVTA